MDIFEKCYGFTEAKEAIAAGIYPYFLPLTENEGTEAVFHGRRLIMCGSNNYLGLTTHPKVRQAAIDAIERYGTSCTGSRFLNGTLELHEQLERELAEWVGKEAALVFSTGMQVNLGTISALVGRGDFVILDKEDHASIVDGARLSFGRDQAFRHNDMADLERVLAQTARGQGQAGGGGWPVQHGGRHRAAARDRAALQEVRRPADGGRCARHGRAGRRPRHGGPLRHDRQVDLIMSTFSKSFASLGGFIAGDEPVIHYIKHHARSLIFSASMPPSNAAAALAALHVMRDEPERVAAGERRSPSTCARDSANSASTPATRSRRSSRSSSATTTRTIMTWRLLFDAGVFVNPVLSPGVQPGNELLRTSYMANPHREQLDRVLGVFEGVGKQVGLI